MSSIPRSVCAGIIVIVAGYGHASAAGPRYVATDLGSLPGGTETDNRAYGINNYGQVVGRSRVGPLGSRVGSADVFLWTPDVANGTSGTMTDVQATPVGPAGADVAVNDRGQVVQTYGILWSPDRPHGTTGTFAALPAVAGGPGATVSVWGINGSGQVVGQQGPGRTDHQAYTWVPDVGNGTTGTAALLGPSHVGAAGINDAGQIVGTSSAPGPGFLYTPGAGTFAEVSVAGTPSAWIQPAAINAAGVVVGRAVDDVSGEVAFRWRPDVPNGGTGVTITGAAFADSRATGVNAPGVVVGYGTPTMASNYGQHAFAWSDADGLVDLNTLLVDSIGSWELARAVGINDAGQIAVTAAIVPPDWSMKPVYHAFLLTPVPEPAGGWVLGGVWVIARRRRARVGRTISAWYRSASPSACWSPVSRWAFSSWSPGRTR